MYLIIFELLGLLCGLIKYFLFTGLHNFSMFVSDLLFCLLVTTTCFAGLFGFVGHYFKSDLVADSIGWPKGNPFQKEIAYANLSLGIGSFGAAFMGHDYWLACIIFVSVFYLGAAIEHIKEVHKNKNMDPGNLYMIIPDILLPVSMIILFILL